MALVITKAGSKQDPAGQASGMEDPGAGTTPGKKKKPPHLAMGIDPASKPNTYSAPTVAEDTGSHAQEASDKDPGSKHQFEDPYGKSYNVADVVNAAKVGGSAQGHITVKNSTDYAPTEDSVDIPWEAACATPAVVSYSVGGTVALPNFENVKFNVSIQLPCSPDAIDSTFDVAKKWVDDKTAEVHQEITNDIAG